MRRRHERFMAVVAGAALLGGALVTAPAQAAPRTPVDARMARSTELSETSRLSDRRTVVTGTRAWVLGTADGRFPAAGFHTRGEMGGFWTPELKLLDGVWFGIGDDWIGKGTRTTSGWGYVRTDLPTTNGVAASRTDVVPDGITGALVGLTLSSASTRTVTLTADAHSELMSTYPWGETTPSQADVNLPDSASVQGRALVFRDRGRPAGANQVSHDWAAAFGSALPPTGSRTGSDFRGPQDEGFVRCPATGTTPERCDDTAYGHGAGGQLSYRVRLRAGQPQTVWFGVGGSRSGPSGATTALSALLDDPDAALAAKIRQRERLDARTDVSLPGDPLVEQSVAWSKQMLAGSEQRSTDVALRVTKAGTTYPAPVTTLDSMRWLGAGWPDYTWLFGTDGEYTAYAAVAAGQFAPIKAHLRTLRDVSVAVNGKGRRGGKIVHEVTPDGAVYFGSNEDDGNTDESAKYPTAVALVWRWTGDRKFLRDLYPAARRAMRHVDSLDTDGDGWPGGLGNVERAGMGSEKLDNAVYTIRGYADLADLADARGDDRTRRWATTKALQLAKRFEGDWWYGGDTRSYADSLDPGDEGGKGSKDSNAKIFQRHWIGLTPTEAVLPGLPGRAAGPLASSSHGRATLAEHEGPCYTGTLGLFHTGTGPTSAAEGNLGPSCDSVVSAVPSERDVFTLNSSIAGVGEGSYGRLGARQQGVYVDGNARAQLDPDLWEMPGAMPEIVPSPRSGANIDRPLTERSMVMQAWGAYGVLWPVVHQWLGVSPDMGRGRVAVVPQLPPDQGVASASSIRVGSGRIDVTARRTAESGATYYATTVTRHGRARLTVGAVLPEATTVGTVTLDGRRITPTVTDTARGREVTVRAKGRTGTARLVVTTA